MFPADHFALLRSFFFTRAMRFNFFWVCCILRRFLRLRAVLDIVAPSFRMGFALPDNSFYSGPINVQGSVLSATSNILLASST